MKTMNGEREKWLYLLSYTQKCHERCCAGCSEPQMADAAPSLVEDGEKERWLMDMNEQTFFCNLLRFGGDIPRSPWRVASLVVVT